MEALAAADNLIYGLTRKRPQHLALFPYLVSKLLCHDLSDSRSTQPFQYYIYTSLEADRYRSENLVPRSLSLLKHTLSNKTHNFQSQLQAQSSLTPLQLLVMWRGYLRQTKCPLHLWVASL